jgi:hypothetical protein
MDAPNCVYVLSYGSLLSRKSRFLSGISGNAYPVRVNEFERSWNCRIDDEMTALGMLDAPGRSLNAALVEIPLLEVPRFDDREGSDYKRVSLSWSLISPYSPHDPLPPLGEVYFYCPVNPRQPNATSCVLLSYVSVALDGILSDPEYAPFALDFAAEFLQSTRGWQFLYDDSASPRYIRHLKHSPHEQVIASLIRENVPAEAFL